MMQRALKAGWICILLIVMGCDKVELPEPEPTTADPVFFSKMQVDGEPIELIAGKKDYVMDANFERDKGVLVFVGTIKRKQCRGNACPQSIRFVIKDVRRFNADAFDVNQSIVARDLPYAWQFSRDSSLLTFQSASDASNANTQDRWDLGGARVVERHQQWISGVFHNEQPYEVSLQARRGQCISTQMQTIQLSTQGCRSLIQVAERQLKVRTSGKAPFAYRWSTGSQDSMLRVADLPAALSMVGVTVTDADGCSSASSIGLTNAVATDQRFCLTHFNYKRQLLSNEEPEQLGAVSIVYISEDGTLYRSNARSQPANARFRIQTVSDFDVNERGQKTKKVKIQFNCNLYNVSDMPEMPEQISLRGESTFAVAYPG